MSENLPASLRGYYTSLSSLPSIDRKFQDLRMAYEADPQRYESDREKLGITEEVEKSLWEVADPGTPRDYLAHKLMQYVSLLMAFKTTSAKEVVRLKQIRKELGDLAKASDHLARLIKAASNETLASLVEDEACMEAINVEEKGVSRGNLDRRY